VAVFYDFGYECVYAYYVCCGYDAYKDFDGFDSKNSCFDCYLHALSIDLGCIFFCGQRIYVSESGFDWVSFDFGIFHFAGFGPFIELILRIINLYYLSVFNDL
jgi:hypothetical protein